MKIIIEQEKVPKSVTIFTIKNYEWLNIDIKAPLFLTSHYNTVKLRKAAYITQSIINTNFERNIAMTSIQSQYSLTEYTNFRKLQFEYAKMKDQNQELKDRLRDLEQLYQKAIKNTSYFKKEKDQIQNQIHENRKFEENQKKNTNTLMQEIFEILCDIRGSSKDKAFVQIHYSSSIADKLKYLYNELENISKDNKKMNLSMKQTLDEMNNKQKHWAKKQQNFSNEIAELQLDIQSLENLHKELQQQNQKTIHENQQLRSQIKSYKVIAIEARNQRSPIKTLPNQIDSEFDEEDKDFANDLLGYEKELLTRVYELVTESFSKDDIGICLKKIYQSYNDVCECFREKLQIQYDLSDLQCQYQKKKGNTEKQAIVELRKQINNFRKQLFSQKELLHKRQQILQERIKDLSGQAVQDNRLKNFTIELQTKLRKHKSISEENEGFGSVRAEFSKMGTGTIQFKQSTATDQLVKQMIRKDRENIEKMLKQTRNQFRK